jgi:hypothetical protein
MRIRVHCCLVAVVLLLGIPAVATGLAIGLCLPLRGVLPVGALVACTVLLWFLAAGGLIVLIGMGLRRLERRRREQFWARPELSDEAFAALFPADGQPVAAAVRDLLGQRIAQDRATRRLLPDDHVLDLDITLDELSWAEFLFAVQQEWTIPLSGDHHLWQQTTLAGVVAAVARARADANLGGG